MATEIELTFDKARRSLALARDIKSFQRLFEDRQRGDYEPGVSVSARNAGQDIAEAEKIVTAIGAYLRENGHLAA